MLLTGGAGFIGANLALHLREAYPTAAIVCMDSLHRRGSALNLPRLLAHDIAFHRGDVRHASGFPDGPFDVLIECSAEPSVMAGHDARLDFLFHTNLVGAFNCLEQARRWQCGLLFLSTSRVYPIGRLESHPWSDEDTRFSWTDNGPPGISSRGVQESLEMRGARSLYGYTKYAAELLIEEYRARWRLKAVVNRCGTVAGPWQFGKVDQGLVSLWVLAHHFGRPLTYIGHGGSGKQVRDVLHVDDLCALIAEQIRDFGVWDGWVGNVAGGLDNSVSLLELTALCRDATGRAAPISEEPASRPDDVRIFIGDGSRLFERTAWRPRRPVRQTVVDVANWVREHEGALATLIEAQP